MKKMLFAGLLTVALSTALFAREYVANGKTHSLLGDYKIALADKPVIINGMPVKAFVISYQNSPMEVTVAITKGKNCKNYIVLSDKLSVEYVCNGQYIGVQKLENSLVPEGFTPTEEGLNRSEFFHQKLLVWGQTDELENTQLIAAYFPLLINEEALTASK